MFNIKSSRRGKPGVGKVYRFLAGCVLLALAAKDAGTQTRVDLRTQSKSVDFSAAPSTKPFQSGTALPGACSQGQTFFKTNAAAGANFYACTSTDTWTLEGGTGNAALSYLTTNTESSLTDSRRIAAGTGIGPLVDTGPAGTLIIPLDTAVALTKVTAQAGAPWSLIPASASGTVYSVAASPALTAYTRNQFFSFIPDVNCGNSPALNIDSLGPIALKKISGGALVAVTANDCLAGVPYHIRARGNPVDAFVLSTDAGGGGGTPGGSSGDFQMNVSGAFAGGGPTWTHPSANKNRITVTAGSSDTSSTDIGFRYQSSGGANLINMGPSKASLGDPGISFGPDANQGTIGYYTGYGEFYFRNQTGIEVPINTKAIALTNLTLAQTSTIPNPDGLLFYCTDCKVTSGVDNTCTGSGTGAFLVKINGVKKCLQ